MDILQQKKEALRPRFDSDEEKAAILGALDVAEIDDSLLMGSRLLVAKWIRRSEGKIQLTTATRNEDKFQGKVGLVLKVGPLAFEDDATHDWRGQRARPGDWVLFGYGDGTDFDYRPAGTHDHIPCKLLGEGDIAMVIPRPDFAY